MTTNLVLQKIESLSAVTSDKAVGYKEWDPVYDYLKKLSFNDDARKIIKAIAEKYGANSVPSSRMKEITAIVKKGADALSGYKEHAVALKNRAIIILSGFVCELSDIKKKFINVSDLNLEVSLGAYISNLEFNEDSCAIVEAVINLFKGYETFPGKISGGVRAFVNKEVNELKKTPLQKEDDKEVYNKKVAALTKFFELHDDMLHGVVLPRPVEPTPAWEITQILSKTIKTILRNIKQLEEIKPSMESQIKALDFNTLNLSCGKQGTLAKYITSDNGKKDQDFRTILLKIKISLEMFYGEGPKGKSEYHNLWDFLNRYARPLPPIPPVEELTPFKSKLEMLKTGLYELNKKLNALSKKLEVLKNKLAGSQEAVPNFDLDSKMWWIWAKNNSDKITKVQKKAIQDEWDKIKKKTSGVVVEGKGFVNWNDVKDGQNRTDEVRESFTKNLPDDLEFINQVSTLNGIFDQTTEKIIKWLSEMDEGWD